MLTAIAPGPVPEHRRLMTTSPVPIPPPPLPPPPPAPPAVTLIELAPGLRAWARAAQVALVSSIVFAAGAIGARLACGDLLGRTTGDTGTVRLRDLQVSDDQILVVTAVGIGVLVLTGIVFLVWWIKAYGTAAGSRGDLRYGRGRAIGGWFVPFAGWVVPKRVADDLWTAACEPDRPCDAGTVRSGAVLGWWIALAGGRGHLPLGRVRT